MKTSVLRPRALAHRGVVMARGVWIGPLVPEIEAQKRVLAVWENGARLWRLEEGWLLLWPRERRLETARAPGVPLVEKNGVFWAAPDLKLEVARGSVVLVQNGEFRPVLPSDERDPAFWLDLSAWENAPVETLGAPPAPPVLAVVEADFEARDRLGVPAAPDLAGLLERLRAVETLAPEGQKHRPGTSVWEKFSWNWNQVAGAWASGMGGILRLPDREPTQFLNPKIARDMAGVALFRLACLAIVCLLNPRLGCVMAVLLFVRWALAYGWSGNLIGVSQPAQKTQKNAPAPPPTPASPRDSWRARLMARFLLMSRLGRVLGRQQARYIGRMMEMFERGDLEAALRHAIPLGGQNSGDLAPGWGMPSARDKLQIEVGESGGRPLWLQIEGLEEHLKRLYRAAFDRLREQGELEKAAFVLAELLRENEEAVAFLEAQGELVLAAEFAQARGLAAPLVVRQWLVAKRVDRALLVARRSGSFAQAVEWLEKRGQDEYARFLRLHWANERAQSGDFSGALEICAALLEQDGVKPLAREWAERARSLGGVSAARALRWGLLQRGFWDEEAAADGRREIAAILGQNSPEEAATRRTFTSRLAIGPPAGPDTAFLARLGARSLLRDAAAGQTHTDAAELRGLVSLSGDASLKADWPRFSPSARPNWTEGEPTIWKMGARRGPHPISDVAALPGGRFLVALGEVGARLVAADGRTLTHWEQPTHALVVSESGGSAILVARRGVTQRLSRLDLATRKVTFWCETRLQNWAESFDGGSWWVSFGCDISLLDTLFKVPGPPQILWQTREVAEQVVRINFRGGLCQLLAWGQNDAGQARFQTWTLAFHLASNAPRLTRRVFLENVPETPVCSMAPDGNAAFFVRVETEGEEPVFQLKVVPDEMQTSVPLAADFAPSDVWPGDGWTALGARGESEMRLFLVQKRLVRAQIDATGASAVCSRFTQFRGENVLAWADDLGRLVRWDLESGVAREVELEI